MRLCVICGHREFQHRDRYFDCLVPGCTDDCDIFLGCYPEDGDPVPRPSTEGHD